jgi:hypothetical protein
MAPRFFYQKGHGAQKNGYGIMKKGHGAVPFYFSLGKTLILFTTQASSAY